MFSIAAISAKLMQVSQGFTWILPELVILAWILVCLCAEIIQPKHAGPFWRYLITQIGLILAILLAFQRIQAQVSGFVSFHLFWVNAGSNAINALLLVIGCLVIGVNQTQKKAFSFEEQIGFLSILAGCLLTSLSMHFLSIFLSIELMSMGTYILIGLRKDAVGARASLPYLLFGMGTSAILLYGFSLLYGMTGSMQIMSATFSRGIATADPTLAMVALGMVAAGILFKMSWAPFHPWSPDVLESLPASWMAWISTAPKIAIAWLGIKFIHFIPFQSTVMISLLAILTLLVGNLGAIRQQHSKRLFAYSSIAHGGFLAMAWLFPSDQALDALLFYGFVYSLSTILVFYLVDETASEDQVTNDMGRWPSYAANNPRKAFLLFLGCIALIGFPPAGTFLAKVMYFSQLWEKYQNDQQAEVLLLFLVALAMTAVSLVYYLRIPFHMYLKKTPDFEKKQAKNQGQNEWAYWVLALVIIATLVAPSYFLSIWKG